MGNVCANKIGTKPLSRGREFKAYHGATDLQALPWFTVYGPAERKKSDFLKEMVYLGLAGSDPMAQQAHELAWHPQRRELVSVFLSTSREKTSPMPRHPTDCPSEKSWCV